MTKVFDREHSHSSLNTYTACSYSYKLRYVDKLKPPLSDRTVALEAGSVAHNALEYWFKLKPDARPQTIDPLLDAWWATHLRDKSLSDMHQELTALANDVNALNKRVFYNKNGEMSRAPRSTAEYKNAHAGLNIGPRQATIDQVAAQRAPDPWGLVSLSGVYAETRDILAGWAGLPEISEVISVERQIRETDLKLPGGERFQVRIDLVARLDDGRLAVIDHKTGGKADEPPYEWEVANHDQLLAYGWALDAADGIIPDVVGLHHVRGKVLVVADFDYTKAMTAITRKQGIIHGVNKGVFVQQSPSDFRSPCYDSFFGRVCPWLPVCHPAVYEAVSAQAQREGKNLST